MIPAMPSTAETDLLFRPVDELAGLVRSGDLSARELVQASLDRIEQVNPKVNAFVDVFAEEALAAADAIGRGDERPLAGVPIAIKNNVPIAGKRLTFGSPFTGDLAVPADHNVVTRLRDRAGCVIVGTTTLPEWGIQPVTETRRFGATRNPWDLERTPGGSSGGSAAAVASGMVPIAHGNDGGGSIRIPAACCGLVGLKPQRGRVSMAPAAGEQFLSIDGVLTRTVAESALALDVLAGPELGDSSWAPPPAEAFAESAARAPQRLRVALMLEPLLPDVPVDAEAAEATRAFGALLEELGHGVEEVAPPFQSRELMAPFTAVFGPMCCSLIAFVATLTSRQPGEADLERLSAWLYETSRGIDAIDAYTALMQIQGVGRAFVSWASSWDVVVTPALAQRPLPIGTLDPDRPDPQQVFRDAGAFTPFTPVANITGSPGIALPFAQRDDGLPLGVQVLGRPTDEATLLALGAQVEEAQPWADRRAPVS